MLSRALGIGLALSLAANASLGLLYRSSLIAQGEIAALAQAQAAEAANQQLTTSLGHQATAFEAREAELLRRLELSDQVAQAAAARAESTARNLRTFEVAARAARSVPDYDRWADEPLPAGVADRLRTLP